MPRAQLHLVRVGREAQYRQRRDDRRWAAARQPHPLAPVAAIAIAGAGDVADALGEALLARAPG